jgi:hypothetical protein
MSVADDRARARLAELRREYQEGERQLQALVQQETALRETLLRISGAVQVLTELLDEPEHEPARDAVSAAAPDAATPRPAADSGAADAPHVLTVP